MKQKKVYPTNLFIRFLVHIIFTLFTCYYRVKKQLPKEVENLNPPYLILANHVGFWDPFVIGYYLPHFIHFVSSDAVFRNPLLRFFLTRLGAIPKKKNMRDSQVIRDIASIIKQGENVGIFPEAVRTWSGSTSPMDTSIGKLIKMLKVPVVVPILKGMNLLHPRWSYKLRSYPLEVEYKLLFTKEDVINLNPDELYKRLTDAIAHDEVAYQQRRMKKINSDSRAEYINHALYLCPNCLSIDSFVAFGNDFHCKQCGYSIHIDDYGFFSRNGNGNVHFDNIRDWFNWEEKTFIQIILEEYNRQNHEALFTDKNMRIYKNNLSGKLVEIGMANVSLYIDKIIVDFFDRESLEFNLCDLQTINPQTKERLEIYYNKEAYRVEGTQPGVSALKWEVAVNTIWKEMGLDSKMVPYIRI